MTTKTKLLFTSNESAQNFCVGLKSTHTKCNDIIQVWQPSQLNQNLIGSFDLNISNNEQCTMIKSIQCPSALIDLNIPKCSIAFKDFSDNRNSTEPFYLVATYQNGTTGFIDTNNYNQFFTGAIPLKTDSTLQNNELDNQNKKLKLNNQEYILSMDQSLTGSVTAGITNLCRLVTVRPSFIMRDLNNCTPSYISHMLNLYEYCLLTGYDYWDLLVSTQSTLVDILIERIEEKYSTQINTSFQRVYFSQHNALLYSLCRRSINQTKYKPLDIISKMILNRSVSIISFGVQFALNVDSLATNLSANPNASNLSSMINKSVTPSTVNSSLINLNLDLINTSSLSAQQQQSQSILGQIKFKHNLSEYFNDVLKTKLENNLVRLNLNEIIQSVLSRKCYQILVNQQLRHVFQWILDLALNLINIAVITKKSQTQNPSDNTLPYIPSNLLGDVWVLNEIRKALIYMKLLFVYSSLIASSQPQSQVHQSYYFITSSLPVLPLKSSMQKDLITELFNIYTKFLIKITEGNFIEFIEVPQKSGRKSYGKINIQYILFF